MYEGAVRLPQPGRVPVWEPAPADDAPLLTRARAALVAWVEEGASAQDHPRHHEVVAELTELVAVAVDGCGGRDAEAMGKSAPLTAYLVGLAGLYGAVALAAGPGSWLEAAARGFALRGEPVLQGLALLQAGHAAEGRGDDAAAVDLYREAACLLETVPGWRGAAHLSLAEVLARCGAERSQWEEAYGTAASDLEEAGDHSGLGFALRCWARAVAAASGAGEALPLFNRAREAYMQAGDPVRAAECDLEAGILVQQDAGERSPRVEGAIRLYQRALRTVQREDAPQLFGLLHSNLASAYLSLPPHPEREPLRRALAVQSAQAAANSLDPGIDPAGWALAQHNLGAAYVALAEVTGRQDLLERAETALRAALAVRRRVGDPKSLAATLANLGECLIRCGYPDPDAARAAGQEACMLLAEAVRLGADHGLPGVERVRGRLAALQQAMDGPVR